MNADLVEKIKRTSLPNADSETQVFTIFDRNS
jgi:hypothetical protein